MTYFSPFSQLKFNLGYFTGSFLGNLFGAGFCMNNCGFMSTPSSAQPWLYTYYPQYTNNIFSTPDTGQIYQNMPSFTNIKAPDFSNQSMWSNFTPNYNINFNYKVPDFKYTLPDFSNFQFNPSYNWDGYNFNVDYFSKSNNNGKKKGFGANIYCTLNKNEALIKAKADPNLEELKGGNGWILANTFKNDIPYARAKTAILLDKVYSQTGIRFQVTSALGTRSSYHSKGIGYDSHYNPQNPKLDIQPQNDTSITANNELAKKLRNTGLFSLVRVESHGNTAHIDVQFSPKAYESV